MTEIPFHATRMGQRFYEHTMPDLVRQLARLNESLERLVDRGDQHADEQPDHVDDDDADHDRDERA